jgi:hypothetical protein
MSAAYAPARRARQYPQGRLYATSILPERSFPRLITWALVGLDWGRMGPAADVSLPIFSAGTGLSDNGPQSVSGKAFLSVSEPADACDWVGWETVWQVSGGLFAEAALSLVNMPGREVREGRWCLGDPSPVRSNKVHSTRLRRPFSERCRSATLLRCR